MYVAYVIFISERFYFYIPYSGSYLVRLPYIILTLWRPVVTICTTRFNLKIYVLPTQYTYVFYTDLTMNSCYYLIGFYNRGGACLLRGKNWVLNENLINWWPFSSTLPPLVVTVALCLSFFGRLWRSRRPFTADAHVRPHVSPCDICAKQSATAAGFHLSTLVFPCWYHSISTPYSSSSTCCSYQKGKGRSREPPKKVILFWKSGSIG